MRRNPFKKVRVNRQTHAYTAAPYPRTRDDKIICNSRCTPRVLEITKAHESEKMSFLFGASASIVSARLCKCAHLDFSREGESVFPLTDKSVVVGVQGGMNGGIGVCNARMHE